MTSDRSWTWETWRGSAGVLHVPHPPSTASRTVRELQVDGPAIVLGSSQDAADIDTAAAVSLGIAIERRRSGGGAVLLVPAEHVWLDVWLPAGDPLWVDDVGRAGDWLAAVWIAALSTVGSGGLEAQGGPLVTGEWAARVCFAGLASGEVTAAGRKLVGVSQRRTRDWVRFQCLVHRRWDAATTFGLLAAPGASAAGETWADRVAEIGDVAIEPAVAAALEQAEPSTA